MIIKILNGILMASAIFMGIKQGLAMATGKEALLAMFEKWGFSIIGVAIFGAITMSSAVLIAIPKTFVWGNFIMAAGILMIMCLHLLDKDLKGFAIELPFFLLNLIIIYLQHPLVKH